MSVKEKVAQRKMVRSPGEIIPIVVFSVIAQGDSHKKKTEKHPVYPYSLPLRSMQCSGFYNRIRGCELLSLSLCENVCVCVCVYFSAVGFYLLLLLFFFVIKATCRSPFAAKHHSQPGLDISGLMESSSWPLCLKPRAYRGIFVHFQTTNTAGSNCRFKDFCLSPAPNLSMTYIKLFWD